MSVLPRAPTVAAPAPAEDARLRGRRRAGRRPGTLGSLVELTKPGITRMVAITVAIGYAMAWMTSTAAAAPADSPLWGALVTVFGAALSASGASALNEWLERERDGRMRRTVGRPIPDGRLSARVGLTAGLTLCALGVAALWWLSNPMAALVSLATIVSYIVLYTPLKPVTPLSTIVGAVPGALPPLIGWAGGWRGELFAGESESGAGLVDLHGLSHPGGWSLVLLMIIWQVPHFLAIAWMHREDYARGGHRVLPVLDPTGVRTAATALLWTVALVPASLLPAAVMRERLGWAYVVAALALGTLFVLAATRFARSRADADARRLFFASILHLPLLLAAMALDAALLA